MEGCSMFNVAIAFLLFGFVVRKMVRTASANPEVSKAAGKVILRTIFKRR